jgi:hypothetical protein
MTASQLKRNPIVRIVMVLLATAGLRLDRKSSLFLPTVLLLAAGYLVHLHVESYQSSLVAWTYFVLLFAVRYVYLFTSFVPGGIADRLKARFGERRGYDLYELGTAWMFFQRGLSFALLLKLHAWTVLDALPGFDAGALTVACQAAGFALSAVGLYINVHATLIIGVDTYYYRDLFLRSSLVGFQKRGPYAVFRNPMYGIGQASAYGAAMMVGSLEGFFVAIVNQGLMYLFQFVIEEPHVRKLMSMRPERVRASVSSRP